MKKLTKVFLTIITIALALTSFTNVNAANETIELGTARQVKSYLAGVNLDYKVTKEGKFLYCVELPKETPSNVKATLVRNSRYANGGMAYILKNGYPNKSITGDNDKDYYITQTAVWWYLDKTIGTTYLGEQFKEKAPDNYNIRKYVKQLVEEGYKHRNDSVTTEDAKLIINAENSTEMILKDGYYISNSIKATTKQNVNNYNIELTDAPNGTIIVSSDGTEVAYTNSFSVNANDSFKIKVPLASVKGTKLSIKVKASTNAGTGYSVLEYQPVNNEMQNVIILEKTSKNVSSTLTLDLTATRVTITKIDKNTKQALAGAKLVLKDANGKVITSWTSTTNAHVIRNLSNGTYTIEEESAPTGYLLNKNASKFTITDNNRDLKVTFENTPKSVVVTITKIDIETKQALAGAVLVVRDSTGKEVARFTTKQESMVLTDLANGTYTVEEESAPAGYVKNNAKQTFTIDDEHLSHQITIVNAKEVYVPDTGANTSTIILLILGIGIIGLGFNYIKKNAK